MVAKGYIPIVLEWYCILCTNTPNGLVLFGMHCTGIVLYAQPQPNGAHNRPIQHKQRIPHPVCNETDTKKQQTNKLIILPYPKNIARGTTDPEIDSVT